MRKPGTDHHVLHRELDDFDQYLAAHGYGRTRDDPRRPARPPGRRTRSRRGCRTRRSRPRGLDWHYSAFDVEEPRRGASRALRTLGFAGANVTIPHKQAVVAACDEADGEAVNTLVFRDGRVLGFNTDREILAGIEAHARLR